MKTLTAKELALYLGCEVAIFTESTNPAIIPQKKRLIACKSERAFEISLCTAESLKAKPILRLLSDMTEEEIKDYNFMKPDKEASPDDAFRPWANAKRTVYLLSKHFDLFGWIKAGLAIDRSTLISRSK